MSDTVINERAVEKTPDQVMSEMWIERQDTAFRANEVMNHPACFPHLCAGRKDLIDLTAVVANRRNYVFCGPIGAVVLQERMPGLYEMHTAVLPEGRRQTFQAARQVFFYMFTRTPCVEILTHCPDGNDLAIVAAKLAGFTADWTVDAYYPRADRYVDSTVYTLAVKDWAKNGWQCGAIGAWFHRRLRDEYGRTGRAILPHSPDRNHDNVVGAAVAMIAGGQVAKGVSIYDRWALLSNHPPAVVVSMDPVIFDLGECRVQMRNQDFEVI